MVKRKGLALYLKSHPHQGGIIVCENPKFIYLKPAKTAGTSILRSFLEKKLTNIFHFKDSPGRYLDWLNRITDSDLEDYFIFSVVRNPYDRMVSVAKYFEIPVEQFLNDIHHYWKDENIRLHALPISLYTHFDGQQFVDYYCRFETLQPDFNLVLDRIKIQRENLPIVNSTKHKHYSVYYKDKQIKEISTLFADDIKYYGYSFDRDAGLTP